MSVRFAVGGKSKNLVFEHYPSPFCGVRGLVLFGEEEAPSL